MELLVFLANVWPTTWPNLSIFQWDQVYSITTIKLPTYHFKVLAKYLNKCGFYIQKNLKNVTKSAISPVALFVLSRSVKSITFYIFNMNYIACTVLNRIKQNYVQRSANIHLHLPLLNYNGTPGKLDFQGVTASICIYRLYYYCSRGKSFI